MAHISPMCSTMVARARGMMVTAAVRSIPLSRSERLNRPNSVSWNWKGSPIQGASISAWTLTGSMTCIPLIWQMAATA